MSSRRIWLCLAMAMAFSVSQADDLLSIYDRAVESSPELKGSEYTVELAKAIEDRSFGELLPQVNVVGSYSFNRYHSEGSELINEFTNDYPGRRASVSLRQPLFDLQTYLLMKSQQARTSQSEQDLLNAHQKLIADIVERYVDALEAADKSEIIAAELDSTEQQLQRVTAMQARQMALITDLYELQARVETLKTELIDRENDARIALEKLRELTGDEVGPVQPIRLDAPQPPPEGSIDSWVKQTGQLNPELQALKYAIESARQSISAYRAGYLPRIELQLSGIYSDTNFDNRQSPAYDVGTLAVQATVPIYNGGITDARVREAKAREKLGQSQMDQRMRELEKLTRAAYLDMETSPSRSLATDRQLAATEKSRDAMKKGYELGVVTIVDLLSAEKRLSEARLEQRQARYRYFKARSSLYFQAGRLIGPELAVFNDWLASSDNVASAQ